MKALREAKACLSNPDAHPMAAVIALQHLVAEIEAVPVTTVYELTDVEAGGMVVDAWGFKDGQRVRVLAVGE